MTVLAYSWQLEEVWSLELGERCNPQGGVAIADDGVMYITREHADGIDLMAIQTTSPGHGESPLPTLRHNNRRTGWMTYPGGQ